MKAAKILTPADYRAHAQRCRDKAERAPATSDEYLFVAAHWDVLADHAEALLRYEKQLKDPSGPFTEKGD
jgi:hypothetical protein